MSGTRRSSGGGCGSFSMYRTVSYPAYPTAPPLNRGSPGRCGPRNPASQSSSARSGSGCGSAGPLSRVIVGPVAWKVASGSAPTKLYRPTRSPPTTLSNRKQAPGRRTAANADTGVRASATSRRNTGTTVWVRARPANVAGSGWWAMPAV